MKNLFILSELWLYTSVQYIVFLFKIPREKLGYGLQITQRIFWNVSISLLVEQWKILPGTVRVKEWLLLEREEKGFCFRVFSYKSFQLINSAIVLNIWIFDIYM